ncbi:hypothetical protein [Mycolicibacterium moriokaense]|uniref:hypothetical protein n=1 Tax=Mycolicibacterium moriokaense TaxID=39691 RepID=UPI001056AA3F|nr:hypothetical protein [Mycolicibacterium moriokaense]MCV7039686.1 hypothetical protein [Mycolicibacterium moriokaense]
MKVDVDSPPAEYIAEIHRRIEIATRMFWSGRMDGEQYKLALAGCYLRLEGVERPTYAEARERLAAIEAAILGNGE